MRHLAEDRRHVSSGLGKVESERRDLRIGKSVVAFDGALESHEFRDGDESERTGRRPAAARTQNERGQGALVRQEGNKGGMGDVGGKEIQGTESDIGQKSRWNRRGEEKEEVLNVRD